MEDTSVQEVLSDLKDNNETDAMALPTYEINDPSKVLNEINQAKIHSTMTEKLQNEFTEDEPVAKLQNESKEDETVTKFKNRSEKDEPLAKLMNDVGSEESVEIFPKKIEKDEPDVKFQNEDEQYALAKGHQAIRILRKGPAMSWGTHFQALSTCIHEHSRT